MTEIKASPQYTIWGLELNRNYEAVSAMSPTCGKESEAIFIKYNKVSTGNKVNCNL